MVLCREALLAGLLLLSGSWRPALLQPSMHASPFGISLQQRKNLNWPCANPSSLAVVQHQKLQSRSVLCTPVVSGRCHCSVELGDGHGCRVLQAVPCSCSSRKFLLKKGLGPSSSGLNTKGFSGKGSSFAQGQLHPQPQPEEEPALINWKRVAGQPLEPSTDFPSYSAHPMGEL